jgi:nitrite reductase/ring-hydroxylating ferredoxin subunit
LTTVSERLIPPCSLSRRKFCAAAGLGLVAIGVPGCDPGAARVSVGGVDDVPQSGNGNHGGVGGGGSSGGGGGGGGGGGNPDMASGGGGGGNPDMAGSGGNPDLAQAASCPSSSVNCGAASALAVGQATRHSGGAYDFYLCRDSGGLFTVDTACTHNGCPVQQQGSGWFCNCHGATFAFDGTQPTSPAFSPLANYAVCVDANGVAWVDYNTTVSSTTRA